MTSAQWFFGANIAFLLGVAAASLGLNFFAFLGGAAVVLFLTFFYFPLATPAQKTSAKTSLGRTLTLLCILFFGFFYYHLYLNIRADGQNIIYREPLSFTGLIAEEPRFTDKTQYFNVALAPPLAGKIRIVTAPVPVYRYGDLMQATGIINPASDEASPPVSLFPKLTITAHNQGSSLKRWLFFIKERIATDFAKILPADAAALLSGITLGVQSSFSASLKSAMAASSTTHVVALSGYNIAVIISAIGFAGKPLLPRKKLYYLTVGVIFLFVLMAGAEASVVRAAIMGFLVLFAQEQGRNYSFKNAAAFAASLMVLINPTVLLFNIGFQLSFASLLGIAYLKPPLDQLFMRRKELPAQRFIWQEQATTTIAAQLAVIPILVSAFNQLSLLGVLANILILEFIPLTMFLGFLLAAVNFIFLPLGFVIARIVELFLSYEIAVMRFFGGNNFALSFSLPMWYFIPLYYALLTLFVWRMTRKIHEQT